jgi:P-type E1-E2 ATPase
MIELAIPGRGTVQLDHLVCDVNGTLALDGKLIEGVPQAFNRLREHLQIHLITADTHGRQAIIDQQLNLKAERLKPGDEAGQKAAFVRQLSAAPAPAAGAGEHGVVAIGQGANDAGMLRTAALGIAVLSREGLAIETLMAADLVMPDILAALELLENPLRIVATLRK